MLLVHLVVRPPYNCSYCFILDRIEKRIFPELRVSEEDLAELTAAEIMPRRVVESMSAVCTSEQAARVFGF